MALWIDGKNTCDATGYVADNEPAFLVEVYHENNGRTVHYLDRRPPHTNQSFKPQLNGWCGTTNNVARYGRGLAKIVRRAKNGRVLVVPVEPTREVLETLGYPDLAE
jgi:hypothetical protein